MVTDGEEEIKKKVVDLISLYLEGMGFTILPEETEREFVDRRMEEIMSAKVKNWEYYGKNSKKFP